MGGSLTGMRLTIIVVLIAIGLVWIGQGTGTLTGGSFMVGDARWALIGSVSLVAGVVLGVLEVRRRRSG